MKLNVPIVSQQNICMVHNVLQIEKLLTMVEITFNKKKKCKYNIKQNISFANNISCISVNLNKMKLFRSR